MLLNKFLSVLVSIVGTKRAKRRLLKKKAERSNKKNKKLKKKMNSIKKREKMSFIFNLDALDIRKY